MLPVDSPLTIPNTEPLSLVTRSELSHPALAAVRAGRTATQGGGGGPAPAGYGGKAGPIRRLRTVSRKRRARQRGKGPRQRAPQVILGVRVMAGKLRAGLPQDGLHGLSGGPLAQQFFGDPEVGDAPIRVGKALGNTQTVQPGCIDGGGIFPGPGRRERTARGGQRMRNGPPGAGPQFADHAVAGGLYQRRSLGGERCV